MRKLALAFVVAGLMTTITPAVTRAEDILVGVAGPITGQDAAIGEQMRRGAERAVIDINAAGGVLGKKLRLIIGDDQCDATQAVTVANKMASDGVIFVDGHYCSSTSIPASSVYNEAGILQITPASTNPKLTDDAAAKGWNNVFRTTGRDDAQGAVAGKYLATTYAGKKIAIIHDRSAYGQGLADETRKAMNAAGLKEAMYDTITQGDRDFSALISKMKQAGIDVVYLGGYHTEAGLLIRQARDQGFAVQLIAGDALVTDEFWKITGKAGEGVMMTFPPDPRSLPMAKPIVEEFAKDGYNPEGYTLYTYAAMQVFAAAASKAKSLKLDDLSAAIHAMTIDTVIGPLQWDAKGDILRPEYVFYVWHDGARQQLSPS